MPISVQKHWMSHPRLNLHREKGKGFTLIEMALVIVLLGILTAGVTMTLLPKLQLASIKTALDRLIECDERARAIAKQGGQPVRLIFDSYAGTVTLAEDKKPEQDLMRMTGRLSLGNVVIRSGPQIGRYSVEYGIEGRSESFAIGVRDSSEPAGWIFVAGLTGQVKQSLDGRQVETLFKTLSSEGADTH